MKNLLAHTFNIAACVTGGALLAVTPFFALASLIAEPGSPSLLLPVATLAGGVAATAIGYTRTFGGDSPQQKQTPAAPNSP